MINVLSTLVGILAMAPAKAGEAAKKAGEAAKDAAETATQNADKAAEAVADPPWDTLHAWAPLPEASTFAPSTDSLYMFIVWLSVFFFALVMGAMFWFMWKYRRQSEDQKTSSITHNGKIEFLWSAVPAVLLVVIFVWSELDFVRQTMNPPDAIEVRVTGRQWYWTVEYPDYPGVQLTTSVEEPLVTLMVPKGRPVRLIMNSKDVIHSFFIPAFRVKRDVVPGRYTSMWFEATQLGQFNMYCAEYCGDQHSQMTGIVQVLEPDLFEDALIEAGKLEREEGESLVAYGERIYKRRGCNACHSVDGSPKTGPTWQGLWGRTESFTNGESITIDGADGINYIQESILYPNKVIVSGYQGVQMPSFVGTFEEGSEEINAIVAYIKTLKE